MCYLPCRGLIREYGESALAASWAYYAASVSYPHLGAICTLAIAQAAIPSRKGEKRHILINSHGLKSACHRKTKRPTGRVEGSRPRFLPLRAPPYRLAEVIRSIPCQRRRLCGGDPLAMRPIHNETTACAYTDQASHIVHLPLYCTQ
jgi:hypothetical protein